MDGGKKFRVSFGVTLMNWLGRHSYLLNTSALISDVQFKVNTDAHIKKMREYLTTFCVKPFIVLMSACLFCTVRELIVGVLYSFIFCVSESVKSKIDKNLNA